MDIIIDGYNLIFQCGLEGKNRTPVSIEKARGRLVHMLVSQLEPTQLQRTTIVFDARRLPIKETQIDSRKQGIRILFAVGYPDADTLIEELIRKHSSPKQLLVVSSDHRIQTAASRRKAKAIDSDAWLDELDMNMSSPLVDSQQEKEQLSGQVSNEWTKEFQALMQVDQNIDKLKQPPPPDSNPSGPNHRVENIEDELNQIDWNCELGLDN